MDDVTRQVANLSPAKLALLELRLKEKITGFSDASERKSPVDDIAERVVNLSPAKLSLLEFRLKQLRLKKKDNDASDSPERKSPTGDITEQIAHLSPAKLGLLELRLKQLRLKKKDAVSSGTPERKSPTGDITEQIAHLSPAKLALLELRLKQLRLKNKGIDSADSPERGSPTGDITEQVAHLSPAKLALLELRLRQKRTDVSDALIEEYPPAAITGVETETEIPDWLAELPISRSSDDTETVIEEEIPATWLSDFPETSEEISVAQDDAMEAAETETAGAAELDWLKGTSFEELETPAWLLDTPEVGDQEDTIQAPSEPAEITESEAHPAPSPAAQPAPMRNVSGWLEALRPTDEAIAEDADNKTAESTGMLAGLTTLLPSEKVLVPSPEGEGQQDDLFEAAQEFYNIATQAPQPATLPPPLTRREKVIGNTIKAILYLLFIGLIALPLFPGLQKIVDAETDKRVPWTEPANTWSDVLDSQRRQLISEQLGIIDLQLPESVALVSFDYSTATQGEIQPLAEAVIGRLKGQQMRIIAISLAPEGALIAQKTLDNLLAERDGQYGVDAVNLGYLPGQVTAIRELVTARKKLSDIADFKEGLMFGDPGRDTWSDVKNLDQVDVIVTLADNPTTARWWVEQLEMTPPADSGERFLLAATSANAAPFLQPYRDSDQLNGLISGINGAAAIEAGRNQFGPARQMLDSQSVAHLIIVILIAIGTMVGWMPSEKPSVSQENGQNTPLTNEEKEPYMK